MNKSLLVLVALLLVLLAVFLWSSHSEKEAIAPSEVDNFVALDSGAVNKIEVKKLGSHLEFTRQPDGWYLVDSTRTYKTAAGMVEDIEKLSYGLDVGEMVSDNPEKQMLFQVDTLLATYVQFYRDGNLLGALYVGKAGPSYQETYVRKPGSDEVYLAKGSLSYLFNRPPSGFRDKTLLSLKPDQISTIQLSGKETDYSIMHQDTLWKVLPAEGEAFVGDQAKIGRLIAQLGNFRFNDFVTNPDSLNISFNKPDFVMEIGLADGTDRRLDFVAEGGDSRNYYVKSSTADEPYVIYDYMVNNLAKKSSDLKPPETN